MEVKAVFRQILPEGFIVLPGKVLKQFSPGLRDVHAPLRIRAMLLRAGGEFDWNDAPFEIVSLALPSNDPVFSDSFE